MSAFLLGIGFRADMGTCSRKLVLLKLIDACEDDGTRIFPATATVARAAQCSTRQVQREIKAFLDIGLIRLVRAGGMGPRSTNEYAMDLDLLARLGKEGWNAVAASVPQNKGDAVSPLDCGDGLDDSSASGDENAPYPQDAVRAGGPNREDEKGDTDVVQRVTSMSSKGDKLCHPTPPDSSLEPSEREGAGAGGQAGASAQAPASDIPAPDVAASDIAASDTPGKADFEKRVMRFCNGTGFAAGPWPNWDTSSPGWIGKQFGKLSVADRGHAERWRDAYLFDIAARKKTPVVVGNFLRDRMWEGLDPELLRRADKAREARLAPEDRSRPDGWAPCMGPIGMAWLFAELLAGQAAGTEPLPKTFIASQLKAAWPRVTGWQDMLRMRGGMVFGERWHALKGAMEPVPAGTAVLEAWREEFCLRGWPWLSAFETAEVVFCPRGGPAGIEAFGRAVRGQEAVRAEGPNGEATSQEAAE